jgi:hypothetical protein
MQHVDSAASARGHPPACYAAFRRWRAQAGQGNAVWNRTAMRTRSCATWMTMIPCGRGLVGEWHLAYRLGPLGEDDAAGSTWASKGAPGHRKRIVPDCRLIGPRVDDHRVGSKR